MRIKDLYKDEIKKLIEKNEKHTQEFESQIQKMRDEIEESDSVHNWEAIKQLFIKIISTIATLDDPGCKGAKKE
jgi:demethoxyubiquinone hydroxylase (CLK1/Coq7/Cat5 family)